MTNGTDAVFDVVVVGGGGAGLAAAIEARATGAPVVLLEKNPAARRLDRLVDRLDQRERHAAPARARASSRQPRRITGATWPASTATSTARDNRDAAPRAGRRHARHVPLAASHGVRFYGPMPEPPHRKPRMHNVLPNSRSFIFHLGRAARRAGVDIVASTRATALASETAASSASTARRRTASAGFARAAASCWRPATSPTIPSSRRQFMGPQQAKVDGVNITATGDGQKLALPLGARIVNGDLALGPELRFVPPRSRTCCCSCRRGRLLANLMAWSLEHMPSALLRPFVMSFVTTALAPSPELFEAGRDPGQHRAASASRDETRRARRSRCRTSRTRSPTSCSTRASRAKFSAWPHFISTAPGVAYAYVDDYRRNRPDVFKPRRRSMSWPPSSACRPASLAKTVARTTRRAGNRPKLGEPAPTSRSARCAPCSCTPRAGSPSTTSTACSARGDQPIPGLYAAGSTGQGGLLLKGHGHHLAWAFASGRRAGRNAAFAATTQDTVA